MCWWLMRLRENKKQGFNFAFGVLVGIYIRTGYVMHICGELSDFLVNGLTTSGVEVLDWGCELYLEGLNAHQVTYALDLVYAYY